MVRNARSFWDDDRLEWKAVISMVMSEHASDDCGMFCTTPVIVVIHVSVEKVVVCPFRHIGYYQRSLWRVALTIMCVMCFVDLLCSLLYYN